MSALTGKGFVTAGGFNPGTVGASAIFDGSADYLEQTSTFGVDESSARFILSFWVFRAEFGVAGTSPLLATNEGGNPEVIRFDADDKLRVQLNNNAHVSNMVFRDVGWYHIVVSVEQGGSPDLSVYVNGEAITWGTDGTITSNPSWFDTTYKIRIAADSSTNYAGQYMAQVVGIPQVSIQNSDFTIDQFGQSFAAGTNGTIWAPITDAAMVALVDGASKSNSFCLTDSIAAGTDASSNGNNFTPSGSPTVSDNTPSKVYPVLNPLHSHRPAGITDGATRMVFSTSSPYGPTFASKAFPSTGKWYCEVYVEAGGGQNSTGFGVCQSPADFGAVVSTTIPQDATGGAICYIVNTDGTKSSGGTDTSYGTSVSNTDTMMMAYDADAGKIWFGNNGTWFNSGDPAAGTNEAFSGITSNGDVTFLLADGSNAQTATFVVNFIEGDWSYTAPTGFKALNSANLTAPDYQGADWFNAITYTGDGNPARGLTGVGFQPDFAWFKTRNAARSHRLTDAVRGIETALYSDTAGAEVTETGGVQSFDTDGVTVDGGNGYNANTETHVLWNWRGDGTSGSSNTDGSITSTVNVAAPGHFSFGTYTGTGANATVGHGLPAAPEIYIVKQRTSVTTLRNWTVGGSIVGTGVSYLGLNSTAAVASDATAWNSTLADATTISIGTFDGVNGNTDDYVFYAFRSVPGVCKVGSYTANSSADGPYVYLGFRPRWLMIKDSDSSSGSWFIVDTERHPYNPATNGTGLAANSTAIDATTYEVCDLLSNGFKVRRDNSTLNWNVGPNVYIYIAMADVAGNGLLPPIPGR